MSDNDDDQGEFEFHEVEPEHGAARNSDPDTSHAAAKKLNATEREQQFCDALRAIRIGANAHEVAQWTGERLNSMSPRAAPLVRKGKIYDTGRRTLWTGSRDDPPTNTP